MWRQVVVTVICLAVDLINYISPWRTRKLVKPGSATLPGLSCDALDSRPPSRKAPEKGQP